MTYGAMSWNPYGSAAPAGKTGAASVAPYGAAGMAPYGAIGMMPYGKAAAPFGKAAIPFGKSAMPYGKAAMPLGKAALPFEAAIPFGVSGCMPFGACGMAAPYGGAHAAGAPVQSAVQSAIQGVPYAK
ncbi:MAG: hypothetical protein ACYC5Y_01650 [Symbiobacteriia bacterium]